LIFRKLVFGLAAAFALATAVGVAVVAAAFALFALLRDSLGPAGAAAVVAGVAVLLIAILALVLALMARGPKAKKREDASFAGRALELAREKPLLGAAALASGAFLLAKNPKIASTIVATFLASRPQPKR
jgi:hypothetical protein